MKVFVSEGSRNFAHNLDDTFDRWIARHASDDPGRMTGNQIRMMSVEEFSGFIKTVPQVAIYDMIEELVYIIADIKQQLTEHHRLEKRATAWVNSANRVKRQCGAFVNALQQETGRRHPKDGRKDLATFFMKAAGEMLPDDQFREIKRAAIVLRSEDDREAS